MLSDEWLQRYRLLENFTAKWNGNGNGNAYDLGDYNSSFALRAVELKRYRTIILLTALYIQTCVFKISKKVRLWGLCFLYDLLALVLLNGEKTLHH